MSKAGPQAVTVPCGGVGSAKNDILCGTKLRAFAGIKMNIKEQIYNAIQS